jgi:hypothetical protein
MGITRNGVIKHSKLGNPIEVNGGILNMHGARQV